MQNKAKRFLSLFLGVFGIGVSLYSVLPKGISYNNVGIWALFILGAITALRFLLLSRFKKLKLLNHIISKGLWVCLFVLVSGAVIIYTAPKNLPEGKDATLVVLGARTFGTEPGGVLKGRLLTAAETLKENPDMKCIVTGGKGEDEEFSEAFVSKEFLKNNGIEEDRIFLEDKSTSTKENISYSLEIAKKENLSEVFLVCTDPYHQYRAHLFLEEEGIEGYSLNSPLNLKIEPIYLVREILAVFYYFII
jgi:uncharacterized SAM-binding protein YcdF (DUF218 family)